MAKKNQTESNEGGVRKFTIAKLSTKSEAVAKVAIPTIRIDVESESGAAHVIAGLIAEAVEATGATHLRGTLTLYVK